MKQLVAGTIVLSLIASNILVGENYIINKRKFDQKVENQSKIIKNLKKNLQESTELDKKKDVKIHILTNGLNKVKNDLDQSQKQNVELQKSLKQLEVRKEVNAAKNKSYYEVTAFTPNQESTGKSVGDKGYRVTASGEMVQDGLTIACPSSMPFGTKVNIQNVGIRVCQDRGNMITSNHIDLYMESLNKAIAFGRKKLLVEIIN